MICFVCHRPAKHYQAHGDYDRGLCNVHAIQATQSEIWVVCNHKGEPCDPSVWNAITQMIQASETM